MPDPRFTILVPCRNEAGNLPALLAGIEAACAPLGPFEGIVIDDGSTDDTAAVVEAEAMARPWLRLLRHDRSGGQSAGVHSGALAARAPILATLDGDGQNPPSELPKLLAPLLAPGADPRLGLVAGQRVGRRDTLSKRLASRGANALRARLLRDATRDTGCGLKAFRRDAYLTLPFFNHQHRYLPALFARDGWRVDHVDVAHAARGAGRSNYTNWQRALVGIRDLMGVAWLIARAKTARAEEVPLQHAGLPGGGLPARPVAGEAEGGEPAGPGAIHGRTADFTPQRTAGHVEAPPPPSRGVHGSGGPPGGLLAQPQQRPGGGDTPPPRGPAHLEGGRS